MALLYVLAILALTVTTLANHADVNNNCQPSKNHESKSLHDILVDGFDKCFGKVGNMDLKTLANSTQSVYGTRIAIERYCNKEDLIKNCLSLRSSVCNGTQEKDYKFVEDILKIAFSYSCVVSGRYFEHVTLAVYVEASSTDRNAFTDCVVTAKSTDLGTDAQDTTSRMLGLYQEFKVFKQCLMVRLRGYNYAVFGTQLILNGILRSMKCHNLEDGTTRPCETFDSPPSTEEKVCPFVGVKESDPPSFKAIINLFSECVEFNLNQLDFNNLHNLTKIEDFRSLFSNYCQNLPHILNCLGDISSNSKVCQNETDHIFLKLVKGFIEYSIETGCEKDGVNLATIYNGIFNRAAPAMEKTTIRQCVGEGEKVYKSGTNTNDTNMSTQTVLLYRSADVVKQCVLDRSSEVGEFKTVLATFLNKILRAAKCVADDETVVLCETLVNN